MAYPATLDDLVTTHADDVEEIIHAADINALASAVEAIEAEVGTLPSGVYDTVRERLEAHDASLTAADSRLDTLEAMTSGGGLIDIRNPPYNCSVLNTPTQNRQGMQLALVDGPIYVPPGVFKINASTADPDTSLYIPNYRAIYLEGAILQTDVVEQMVRFGGGAGPPTGAGRNRQGGIRGNGSLLANQFANRCVLVDSWHAATFADIEVCDAIKYSFHISPNIYAAGDSDGHLFHHIQHHHDSQLVGSDPRSPGPGGAGIPWDARTDRFIYFQGGGGGAGAGCSDSEVSGNCQVSDGMSGDSSAEQDGRNNNGGIGIEIRNAGRIKVLDFGCFDNTRYYRAAVLIIIDALPTQNAAGNEVIRMYTEAQADGSGPEPVPNAGWEHSGVEITAAADADTITELHAIDRLRSNSTSANHYHLRCRNLIPGQPEAIRQVSYTRPRRPLGSGNGQVQLAKGVNQCRIENWGPVDSTRVVNNGSKNVLVNLLRDLDKAVADHAATVTVAGGIETTLYTDSMPADTLGNDGDKLIAQYAGTLLGHVSNTRQLRFKFGGTTFFDTATFVGTNTSAFVADITIIRESNTAVRWMLKLHRGPSTGGGTLYVAQGRISTGLDLDNVAANIAITGQAVGDNGITIESANVRKVAAV